MNNNIVVTAFYHFTNFDNHIKIQKPLKEFCEINELKGTVLIAKEGINSTISGKRENIDNLYNYLREEVGIHNLSYKESFANDYPFKKLKVRVKREIVSLGVGELNVEKNKGIYINPEDWDEFISREDVVTIDNRNIYEIAVGTFEGAIDPDNKAFHEFPEWIQTRLEEFRNKKIAMCCTGGIRCEKSTTYLKEVLGLNEVYHLKGGILDYLKHTGNKNNKWQGTCFVFDDRVAVDKNLDPKGNLNCINCGKTLSTDDIKYGYTRNNLQCLKCKRGES